MGLSSYPLLRLLVVLQVIIRHAMETFLAKYTGVVHKTAQILPFPKSPLTLGFIPGINPLRSFSDPGYQTGARPL